MLKYGDFIGFLAGCWETDGRRTQILYLQVFPPAVGGYFGFEAMVDAHEKHDPTLLGLEESHYLPQADKDRKDTAKRTKKSIRVTVGG